MLVMLVGYRGSGKSAVGKRLAGDLWQKFTDTDTLIVQRAGRPIAKIFAEDGEQRFRQIESEVVQECCRLSDHVVALGGGAVIWAENRQAIKSSGAKVVYLKCDPEALLKRIGGDPGSGLSRPALTPLGGGIEEIRALLAEREPLYREVATKELEVTHLGIEEAAKYVARML